LTVRAQTVTNAIEDLWNKTQTKLLAQINRRKHVLGKHTDADNL